MEPIRPEVRDELKRAYPGLVDADIDRYEELISLRFSVDPDEAPERIRDLDREREQLVRQRMPRFAEIENAVLARTRPAGRAPKPAPEIRLKGAPGADTRPPPAG